MTTREYFNLKCAEGSDISEHLPIMTTLGSTCNHITEFGVRDGNSTAAWLEAKPKTLICYDLNPPPNLIALRDMATDSSIQFEFKREDTAKIRKLHFEETDLLFIDTRHTRAQLEVELQFHTRVSKYIVLHDTETCGWKGEDGGPGLRYALIDFLLAHPQWRIAWHYQNNNGLTVLKRA